MRLHIVFIFCFFGFIQAAVAEDDLELYLNEAEAICFCRDNGYVTPQVIFELEEEPEPERDPVTIGDICLLFSVLSDSLKKHAVRRAIKQSTDGKLEKFLCEDVMKYPKDYTD